MDNPGSLSIWHVVILLVMVAVFIIPYVKIIKKAGYSGWWVLTMFIPLLNFIMLWVFAFARWPVEERAAGIGAEKVF
jgi:bacteriorhodopsin